MKKLFVIVFIGILLSSFVFIPISHAASYEMPTAWQIVYLNKDGSIDVYDYREYSFESGPPSTTLPYYLNTDSPPYNRTLSYPLFEAYLADTPIENITKPTDIREKWQSIQPHLKKLEIQGSNPKFKVSVPDENTLLILVHYKVSPAVTVVGKDFARTYYVLPTLGKSDVNVDQYYTAFILPEKPVCKDAIVYDKEDHKCPCFMVHRFIVKGSSSSIGKYFKGCDFVLFDAKNLPVNTVQELDAVYPPSILSQQAISALKVDQTYEDVRKWQEAHSQNPGEMAKGMWFSIIGTVVAFLFAGVAGGRKISAYKKYYLNQLKHLPPGMDMPSDDVYRSFFFTLEDLKLALQGQNPYNIPTSINDTIKPEDIKMYINKGGNAFRAIFFSLMQKEYIVPITDGDKLLGFRLQDSSKPLEEHEAFVLEKIKEAARMDVENKGGLFSKLFGRKHEDLATVMNERDPENILLPQEFEAYLKRDMNTINLGNGVSASIPVLVDICLGIMNKMKETRNIPNPLGGNVPEDAPSSIKMWDKISKIFIMTGLGLMMAAGLYFLFGKIFATLIGISANTTFWLIIPLILPVLMFIIGLFMKGSLPSRWLNGKWWQEFLAWYKVEKWVKEFTRIAKKEISAYETLNWDKYYMFAALRGIETLLIKALKISGIIKQREDLRHMYTYWLVSDYMYRSSWGSASRSFVSTYESTYHQAHSSGTSSGGSSTGSSFGGGGGAGGGSTGW
ncbi:MAG: DUF2207 domain-containing protein [Dictyoglomi bacterium]|nr:DUF2207 domain-containing protein [Dictyoglomota bacterium]